MKGPDAELAGYVHELTLDDVPSVVLERARLAILDTIGVAASGSGNPSLQGLQRRIVATSADGTASVIGRSARLPASASAFLNGCAAHVEDFDDSGHSSAHLVPTVFALAEERSSSGAEVMISYIVGREVRMRLNEAIDAGRFDVAPSGPGSRGWHSAGTLGTIGSAAAAARVVGLDTEAVAMALGMSASMAAGVMANFGTTTKCLHVGNAARNGVDAALHVADGATASVSGLFGPGGYFGAICLDGEFDATDFVRALTGGFLLEGRGNRIKPYPCCTGAHGYIEAVTEFVRRVPIDPSEVRDIAYTASPPLVCHRPANVMESRFSGAFAIAAVLLDGEVRPETFHADVLARDEMVTLLDRSRELPQSPTPQVLLEMASGERYTIAVARPPSLTSEDEVVGKFVACAAPVIGEHAAAEVAVRVLNLEGVGDVREIGRHLRTARAEHGAGEWSPDLVQFR